MAETSTVTLKSTWKEKVNAKLKQLNPTIDIQKANTKIVEDTLCNLSKKDRLKQTCMLTECGIQPKTCFWLV